jgi:spore germination protein KA
VVATRRIRNKKGKNEQREEILCDTSELPLLRDLNHNLHQLRYEVGNSPDVVIREFKVGKSQVQAAAIYIDGLADKNMVGDFVMRSLMVDMAGMEFEGMMTNKNVFDFIKDNALAIGEVKAIKDWDGLMKSILSGDTVILIDGWAEAISGSTKGLESRGITEPTTQVVIRGPKDSFNESLGTNVSLIRRRIKSPKLWMETMKIGRVTQTDVAVLYIKGIVNDKLVQEVKQRLSGIEMDGILESGNIEELIQDQTFTPFPTVYNTERPDIVCGNLLEGRVAVFVDGTPFALIAPAAFIQFFQSPEDYYNRYDISTAIRLLRYLAFLISMLGPSIYIAAITFHQEMIPTPLLISLAAQREGVPFPAMVEALLMETSFEILREAGVRMPRAVGQAVSIVGALVLGQAAVQAGIVSSAMVIVVAITGIASFATPAFNMAMTVRLLRFFIMISAGLFGFFGIAISNLMIIGHMCGLRSFGFPYMAPLGPFILEDQKDAVFRLPFWSFLKRPRLVGQNNRIRMEPGQQPSLPGEGQNKGKEDGDGS